MNIKKEKVYIRSNNIEEAYGGPIDFRKRDIKAIVTVDSVYWWLQIFSPKSHTSWLTNVYVFYVFFSKWIIICYSAALCFQSNKDEKTKFKINDDKTK